MNTILRSRLLIAAAGLCLCLLALIVHAQTPKTAAVPPDTIQFYGAPQSPISGGVSVPANRALLFTSGTPPPVADKTAAAGTRARYGDTKTQSEGVLKLLQEQLAAKGLTLKDVIYLRVYVVPDPQKGNKPDFEGWFAAYGEYFNTAQNPTKTARSTISVPALVNPDWLVEIEAVAAYPPKGA
jgi:enamine deaminase RidA (YjgF/YER057c/UK114 family)